MCLMKPKKPFWNVKGLDEEDKRMRIRGLIRDWKAYIICLQETKVGFVTREEVVRNL